MERHQLALTKSADQLRLAIVSTPRSGNYWVRSVLQDAFGLNEISVHNYMDIDVIPNRCSLQLHWYREPNFQRFLSENGFQIVVIARHPLDVLVSVLHFIQHEPLTARWLEGNAEIPLSLKGRPPTSDEFMEYALSWGAENLLSVTYEWWHDRGAVRIRYEDVVRSPYVEFAKLAQALGLAPDNIEQAVSKLSLAHFQTMPNRHGWQGQPGLYRSLITFPDALRIFLRHKRVFDTLGYSVRPSLLTKKVALRNWETLTR
jgi:hypothetical protein